VTGPGGVFEYGDMVNRGFIDSKGNGTDGLLFQYDACSQTVIKDDIVLR
jgi:chitinase